MPVRLWGVDPFVPRGDETWKPLYALCEKWGIDYIRNGPVTMTYDGEDLPSSSEERESSKVGMREHTTTLQTPAGPITQMYYQPVNGSPGYVAKHYIESLEDARRWLSIPVRKGTLDPAPYREFVAQSGEGGLRMIGIGEAMYSVQAMIGSEVFGFWLMEEKGLLHELIGRAYAGIQDTVKQCLAADMGDAYGYVGPELCIPPLAAPAHFREFCFAYDKPLHDLIHDAGKLVWVHCHGDMNPVLEDFVEMGVDCLNPIEPPPIGKLTLTEAKQRCGGRMCLDGGIQNGDFQLLTPAQMVRRTEEVIAQGKPGGGFILCPTSDPGTWVTLSERIIENHVAFVETAMRLAEY